MTNQGKAKFIKEVFESDPALSAAAICAKWSKEGHAGKISEGYVRALRSAAGLTRRYSKSKSKARRVSPTLTKSDAATGTPRLKPNPPAPASNASRDGEPTRRRRPLNTRVGRLDKIDRAIEDVLEMASGDESLDTFRALIRNARVDLYGRYTP